jgi:hypothetical protein
MECQERILGREDKKFCSDACRVVYHNRMNRDQNKLMRNVHNALRRNYRILAELNPGGRSRTSRIKLVERGFDFTFCTHVRHTKSGTYYYLYDQGYRDLNGQYLMLVKKS